MESLSTVAHRRLYPRLTDPNFLTLRSRRLIFSNWALQFGGKRLRVLDIGGRYQPYRPLFEKSIERYFAVDIMQTDLVDVVADAVATPFAPASFDLAIATQVFDYFRDPAAVARQVHAVLKPGGTLLASFAAFVPPFAQNEFWRFTASGVRLILEPFERVEVVPELYSLGGMLRNINLALDTFVRYGPARWAYRRTACPTLNLLGLGLENLKLTSNVQFASNYSVRAVKAG